MDSSLLPNALDATTNDVGGSLAVTDSITKIETQPGLLSPESRKHPAYKPLRDDRHPLTENPAERKGQQVLLLRRRVRHL